MVCYYFRMNGLDTWNKCRMATYIKFLNREDMQTKITWETI